MSLVLFRSGLIEYTMLLLGLYNVPSTFQHLMNVAMASYIDDFVLVYLDYILVYSNNAEECKAHLGKVVDGLSEHKL